MNVRYIGITDEETTCGHCGRVDLARTVVLEWLDADGNGTGEVSYFGSTCAARALAARGVRVTGRQALAAATVARSRTLTEGAYAEERLALYSGPDAVALFRDRNRQWGTDLRSVEWAETALAESIARWTSQVADAALLRGTPVPA